MRKWLFFLMLAFSLPLILLAHVSNAHAQASRTWISGVGDDVNPCSRTAPCKTFAGAIAKTAVNGEINCLDPGGFGSVTITKSLTLDCSQTLGSIVHAGTNGITIPFDSFATSDVRKTVRLRGLSMIGFDTGVVGVRITGGTNSINSSVFVENCVIDGNFAGIARGISDERTGGGELYVTDTMVRNTGATGILISPQAGGTGARIDAVLDQVRVENSNFGISVGNGARVIINRSVFAGNTMSGIDAEGPAAAVEVNVDRSVSSSNGVGISAVASATIRLSNSDISFNGTAINGPTQSFGNNRIFGNGTAGTAPTPIGSAAPAMGQQ